MGIPLPTAALIIFIIKVKKTYQLITQCKGVICHPLKQQKSNFVYDPKKYKSPNVPLQDELPCRSVL